MSHGVCHGDRIFGVGNTGVQENPIGAKFHGDGDVAGGPHTSVDDHGIGRVPSVFRLGELFDDDSNRGGVGNTASGPNRGAGWHHAGGAGIPKMAGHDRIVARVDQHGEPIGDQFFGGFQCADGVGKQGRLVGQDLELDPVFTGVAQLVEQFSSQASRSHGIFGREATGGIRKDGVPVEVEEVEQRPPLVVQKPLATHRYRDGVTSAGGQSVLHDLIGFVFPGSHDQAAVQGK